MNTQNHTPEVESNTPIALGNLLKQTRIEKGLSVGEVAERLKLPARQIEALESGCYQSLPEEVFIKGFITSYARLLELDNNIVQEYLQKIFPGHNSKNASVANDIKNNDNGININSNVRKTLPKWVLIVIAAVIIGGVIYAWQGKSSAESAKQAATASQEVSAQASSAAAIAASNVRIVPMTASDLAGDNHTAMAGSDSSASNTQNIVSNNSMEPTPASAVTNPSAGQKGNDRLAITVDHSSWLQISDKNGTVLLNKLVETGSTQQFEHGAPYRIIIGYAPGVHVTFNGKDVAIPQNNKRTAVLTVGDGN